MEQHTGRFDEGQEEESEVTQEARAGGEEGKGKEATTGGW